jgi:ubiquinone/menaquinone biosynthesis C-methylase UbiE
MASVILLSMPGKLWREQIAFYRRRVGEYDITSYGDLPRAERRIAALVGQLHPAGNALEIACGTGMWTQHLVAHARTVTATDAAPEMIVRPAGGFLRRA